MSQCDTCAFNPKGTDGAASEVKNRLKALICAHAAIPFHCHHSKSGPEYDWKNDPLGPMSLPPTERKICGGWQKMVARLKARHGFTFGATDPEEIKGLRAYQRWLGASALKALDAFVGEKDPAVKATAKAALDDCVRAVFDARDILPPKDSR